jgi:hypothetical protein
MLREARRLAPAITDLLNSFDALVSWGEDTVNFFFRQMLAIVWRVRMRHIHQTLVTTLEISLLESHPDWNHGIRIDSTPRVFCHNASFLVNYVGRWGRKARGEESASDQQLLPKHLE